MTRFDTLAASSVLIIAVMAIAGPVAAGEVICPVCGKSFPDDTEKCPNDSTDLKTLGIPLEKKAAERKGEVESEEEEAGESGEASPAESYSGSEGSSKYKRFDRGGSRRSSKPDEANYKDRESRIRGKGRSRLTEEELAERARRERFKNENTDLLRDYEKRRAASWEDRKRLDVAELRASRARDEAKSHLLNSLGAPLTSLGYRMFWMPEDGHPGIVSTAEIDLNLARYRLRAGFSSLIGVRSLPSRDELIFLEHITIGFQWPWRFSPFVIARGGVGALASERFGEDLVYLVTSVGVEAGIDSWVNPWMAIAPSLGYTRCMIDNAYWDSFTFKISVGF